MNFYMKKTYIGKFEHTEILSEDLRIFSATYQADVMAFGPPPWQKCRHLLYLRKCCQNAEILHAGVGVGAASDPRGQVLACRSGNLAKFWHKMLSIDIRDIKNCVSVHCTPTGPMLLVL